MVTLAQPRFADVLRDNGTTTGRGLDPQHYTAASTVRGRSVLLIADTWTTGGQAQSASWALKNSGATTVGVVVIGRHFDPGLRRNATYLTGTSRNRFSWSTCCVHTATS
jgi:adenine/guanine phosphoribosyltransferase-like PRPP-binding protein